MNKLLWLLDAAWSERLGWTIIHSFWQIAAVTAVYAGASLWLRRSSANARYVLGCLALVAMVGLPLATFALLDNTRSQTTAIVVSPVEQLPAHRSAEPVAHILTPTESESGDEADVALAGQAGLDSTHPTSDGPAESALAFWAVRVRPFLPWLSGGWVLGVVLFSVRPLLGLVTVCRLRSRGLSSPSNKLAQLAGDLIVRLHMRQSVHFAQSTLIQVPTVLGYLRPIVLLPGSALTGLSTEQLELILAHELAHIRRHDYLVNVLQTGIETILFYHPGSWWVSAQVRKERENCCDDVAVGLCGSRGTYVRALLAMEQQRAAAPLVLAASGGSLVVRARRLISPTPSETSLQRATAWLAGALPMGVVAVLLLLGSSIPVNGGVGGTEPQLDQPLTAQGEVEAGTHPELADGEPAAPERKANAGEATVAGEGARPVVAEAGPSELAMTVTLEDGAQEPLKFVLMDTYTRPIKTWENVAPGTVQLELPALQRDRYLLEISASGYGLQHVEVIVSREGISVAAKALELYRRRYAVLRYTVNMQGERQLTGSNVKEGHVAISYGSVPDLHGDWLIRQDKESPVFSFHRVQSDAGFARPPVGASFEDIDLAPQPDQYKPGHIVAEKGMVLLNRIIGDGPGWRRYAKIVVEDVTEKPPKDIQSIDRLLPPTISRKPPVAKAEDSPNDRVSGQVTVTVGLEDGARAPTNVALLDNFGKTLKVWKNKEPGEARVELPELEHEQYQLVASAEGYSAVRVPIRVSDAGIEPSEARMELFRLRYLVLRYAVNSKGQRNLTGPNVKQGRAALAFGEVPELQDWLVDQSRGQVTAHVIRRFPNTGFASAAEGKSFDELDMAPPPEEYSPDEFTFEKGMILFNRVVGHRPEAARYAKLIVEDITETRPKNLEIIGSRPK